MDSIFADIEKLISSKNLNVITKDINRPWGGFFVIDENQAQQFADVFLEGLDVSHLRISGKLSPKILMVKPHTRLSWQYHNRRAEIWKVIQGNAGIVRSENDEEKPMNILNTFETVTLKQGERHRLVGLDDWAVIAEIWQHTDSDNPSNEEDIIRVQDDFGR